MNTITKERPRYWVNIKKTPVIAEIVALAAKHTGVKVEYRDEPGEEVGYNPDHIRDTHGSLWLTDFGVDMSAFWMEMARLEMCITKPLNEPILPDDHPVHQGYVYIANGKLVQFIDGLNMTVDKWKQLRIEGVEPVTEVRRCDINGRRLRLPPKKAEEHKSRVFYDIPRGTFKQKRRKPRNSNKIKKVK